MAFIDSGQTFDKEKHRKKMRRLMVNMDRVKFTFRIPTSILKKFKRKLVEEQTNASQFLNDKILEFIDKN